LTGQPTQRNASTYWAVLKKRLAEEGANELLTNCQQLKMIAANSTIVLVNRRIMQTNVLSFLLFVIW